MAGAMAGQPMFTIEQFELIRRLRNSGVTKEQILQAFDSLDRLDRELGAIYSVPISLAAGFPSLAALHQGVPGATSAVTAAAVNAAAVMAFGAQAQMRAQAQASQVGFSTSRQDTPSRKRPLEGQANGSVESSTPEVPGTPNGAGVLDDEVESSEEFKDMATKGDLYCCEEIKNFVIQYNIKQQQVAVLAGMSQSYVSRYLKGDFLDMSEKSRRTMLKWYLTFRKNPAAIAPAANAVMMTNSPVPVKRFLNMDLSGASEFVNYPKRERFVFRPPHLEVLERFFQEDSYPSQEKRDEIARICNAAVEVPGRHLGDKERVSAQIVANWFANRRKEIKKMAREEGLDISQVPLRGRGRPARFISELTSSDLHLNGHHYPSLSTPIKISPMPPAEAAPQPQPRSSPPQRPSSTQSIGSSHNGTEHRGGTPQSPGTPPSPQNMPQESDENLSLAVEMAAVNQAIMALSGQTPINIKPELKMAQARPEARTEGLSPSSSTTQQAAQQAMMI